LYIAKKNRIFVVDFTPIPAILGKIYSRSQMIICPSTPLGEKVQVTVVSDNKTVFLNDNGQERPNVTISFIKDKSTTNVFARSDFVGDHTVNFSLEQSNQVDYSIEDSTLFTQAGAFIFEQNSPPIFQVGEWSEPVVVKLEGSSSKDVVLTPRLGFPSTVSPSELVFRSGLDQSVNQSFRIRANSLLPSGTFSAEIKYNISGQDAEFYATPPATKGVSVMGRLLGPFNNSELVQFHQGTLKPIPLYVVSEMARSFFAQTRS
jgi:hypothetical protein